MGWRDLLPGASDASKTPHDPTAELLDQVRQLRRVGRLRDAREQLLAAVRKPPAHLEVDCLYWDLCVQLECAHDAVQPKLRAIKTQLRAGRRGANDAVFGWFELIDQLDEPPVIDLDLRARLADAMLAEGHGEAAAQLLEEVEQLDADIAPGLAVRVARAAVASRSASSPQLVAALAERSGIPASMLEDLRQALAAARDQGLRTKTTDEPDDSPIEISSVLTLARRLRVIAARPLHLDAERLSLDIGGQRKALALDQVQALAAVRIDEHSGKSYILIDLLLDTLWSDREEIRTLRIRSSDFDPCQLAPEADDPMLALETLLRNLHAASGAHLLPDADAAMGRPFRAFSSTHEYEQSVLEIRSL